MKRSKSRKSSLGNSFDFNVPMVTIAAVAVLMVDTI